MGARVAAWLLIGLVWLTTACTVIPQAPPPNSTEQSSQSLIVVRVSEANARLEFKVAQILNLNEDSVTIRNVEFVDWPDSCLGLPQTDELCAQVVVPGFKAVAETPKGKYILNGDREKRNFRLTMQVTKAP